MKGGIIKEKIRDNLKQSKIKEALEFGLLYLDHKFFILASSRYARSKKQYDLGTITNEDFAVECNKITNAILDFVEQIEDDNLFVKKKNLKRVGFIITLLALLDFGKIKAIAIWLISGIVILVGVNIVVEKNKATNLDPLEFSKSLLIGHWVCDEKGYINGIDEGKDTTMSLSDFYSIGTYTGSYNLIFKDKENLIAFFDPKEPGQLKYYINYKGNPNQILITDVNGDPSDDFVLTLLKLSRNRIHVEFDDSGSIWNLWLDRIN